MELEYTPYIVLLLVATGASLYLTLLAWQRRSATGATTFAVLTLAIAEWSLAYAMELAVAELSAKIFWAKVAYIGITIVPVAWLAFALQYSNQEQWLTRKNLILLLIVPVITLVLVWSNEIHGLVWRQTSLSTSGPFNILQVSYGGWFWVHWLYSYLLLLAGTIALFRFILRTTQLYRQQSFMLLLGVVIPWVGNSIYIGGLSPVPGLDLTPFAFTLSVLAMGWGLFRYQFLDIVPIARRTIIDNMNDGVIVLDMQGRIVDMNPAIQPILGCTLTNTVGKSGESILPNWSQLSAHHPAELVIKDYNNTPHYFDTRISPLYGRRNQLSGHIVTLRDITLRIQAEEAMVLARDKAIEASRVKSELLANVSHELRTPLGAILGYAEMLQEGVYGQVMPTQQKPLYEIIESTNYLAHIVNDLLDQARLEAGRLQLMTESFEPAKLVDDVQEKMHALATAKGLTISSKISSQLPATLYGDPTRIQQILVNLVSNAIKFTQTGTIHINLPAPIENQWAIEVSDTGLGIPIEAQSHIFEPFRQVDGSVTRAHGGTGLGLSIVKQLTELMGGQISLTSQVGQGSTFTVLLPLQLSKQA